VLGDGSFYAAQKSGSYCRELYSAVFRRKKERKIAGAPLKFI